MDEARWQAVLGCDAEADGQFVYSVETTGVYCRPSCRSRAPRREHVRFHASCEAAEAAGYRPCLRCRPTEPSQEARHTLLVQEVCRALEAAGGAGPSVAELAAGAGISASYLHRLFKRRTGLTPHQYAAGVRAERVQQQLRRSRSVSDAVVEAGFVAPSRFYESAERLGMTPTAWRAGGRGQQIRYALAPCSLGWLLVGATERGLCTVLLDDAPEALERALRDRYPHAVLVPAGEGLAELVARVVLQVDDPGQPSLFDLDLQGTAFQQRVWQALRSIPAGERTSYAALAEAIGAPGAARAVATACAANPVAVGVPCRRALGVHGALRGYRWGLERKRALLAREAGGSGG
jgi:AraC family transcriptional regulator of adaptative response/methylated-DNA-[protein]-cysteine methyltransferase